jgi:hypothetical protein
MSTSVPIGDVCRVAIYDIPIEMVEYLFSDADRSVVPKIMYEDGLCVVTCSCHETAEYLMNFMLMNCEYDVDWYVDAHQTIEYPEEEYDLWEEDDCDLCICGDYLDVFGYCRECHLGLRGINQYRF